MSKRREKAGIIFQKTPRGCVPVSAIDAEDYDALPLGTEFDLVPRTKRSLPQLRTFWAALGALVKATGAWPSKEHLCDALKRDLGYVEVRRNLIGQPYLATDSIALDEMAADEFQRFMDAAMARLAEVTGVDPLSLLPRLGAREEKAA